MKACIIIHEAFELPGAIATWLLEHHILTHYVSVYQGDALPALADFDWLMVMGGPQSPDTTLAECPHFDAHAEMALIRAAITAGKKVLGVCLGAQLIGAALGAPVERSPQPEIGIFPVTLTAAGQQDPYVSMLPNHFDSGHWHHDMPGLPEGAAVLAESAFCPRQIIRFAPNAYGFQCHMEFDRACVEALLAHEDTVDAHGVAMRDYDFGVMHDQLFQFLAVFFDQHMIEEYSAEYCHFLEFAYGKNWMSEGGEQAAEKLCDGIALSGKRILDVGAGLGGLAFYLAQHPDAQVTGLELNPWMVEEAMRRTPATLRGKVDFCAYAPPLLPFADDTFDIVISKGVLVHVHDKYPLFQQFHRVLKPGGQLIINDWLSPIAGQWGQKLQAMCEAESLTLYAHTLSQYEAWLTQAGFAIESVVSEDAAYVQYNETIASQLAAPENQQKLLQHFPESDWQEASASYQGIADSIVQGELLIRRFVAVA